MTAVATRMESVFKVLQSNLNQVVTVSDSYVKTLRGQYDAVQRLGTDKDSEVLSNPNAFSQERLAEVTGNLVRMGGGGTQLQQAAAVVQLKRVVDEIARNRGPDSDVEFVAKELEEGFKDIGQGLGEDFETIKSNLAQTAATAIATGDPKAMEVFNKKAAEAQKILAGIAKLKFDALRKLNTIVNQTAEIFARLNALAIRQIEARVRDENAIKEAMGERLTEEDRTRAFNESQAKRAEQAGITQADIDDGLTAQDFANRLDKLTGTVDAQGNVTPGEIQKQQDKFDAANEKAMMPGATEQDKQDAVDAGTDLAKLKEQSAAATEGLKQFAESTVRLDAALLALAERTKLLNARQEGMIDVLRNPEKYKKNIDQILVSPFNYSNWSQV